MTNLQSLSRRISTFVMMAFVAFGLTACESNIAGTDVPQEANLAVLTSAPEFTTLAQAIQAAELTETLRADGPFTVFAPSNEAFAKLPESAIRTLLQPEHRDKLAELLVFHIVPGRVYSGEVFQVSKTESIQGSELTFTAKEGEVFVNEARIVTTDLEASNGIVHVIDTVMLPEWFDRWFSGADIGIDPLEQR